MRIITHPPHHANLNTVARVLAAFVANLHGQACGSFDAKKCARLLLLSNAEAFNAVASADGDELLSELLKTARRVFAERKGGAA